SYEAECRTKNDIVRDAFERIGRLSPQFDSFLGAENTERYRNKAQYPLAVQDGRAVCGFYAPRSHRVIPVEDCALQPEVFSEIIKTVLDYINDRKLSVYNEETNTGIIRHIYLRRGAHSGEIMVCLVVRKDISRQLNALCRTLTEKFGDIKSIVMNINSKKTNVILGDECITLWGSDTISDTMCGNTVEISPLSFYQVNTVQAERLYGKALEYTAPDSSEVIADLYCGAGTIGLSMAKQAAKIVGVEIVPQAVENAKKNALRNNIANAEFHCGDAGEVFGKLRKQGCKPDIIIVDPPRKGCSPETIDVMAEAAPRKIVMISCNPTTAARDAKLLSERGYSADKVCGVDLFPKTGHVECVVLMSRNEN
ncbi:MAG: 23S rRNA (uracil(1939)-C(5))-methyltransferase RlmD, partial [Ruminococcus sp.]|nr:23S rRNA (uracil(1939)-C(5))-methyltransferase RlmD [Ruminococcus sp.]